MQIDYNEWDKILKEHKAAMDKELAEVRRYKQEMAQMKAEMMELGLVGRYERDSNTLILSAPTVVIGNVDKNGNLLEGNSNVIIRSNNISLEGVGHTAGGSVMGGRVVTRARYIDNLTVDPGIDGLENVAFDDSHFNVQSASVGMMAETIDPSPSGGVFTMKAPASEGSISLKAEVSIDATAACDIAGKDKRLEKIAKLREEDGKKLEKQVDDVIDSVKAKTKALDKNLDNGVLNMLSAVSEDADTMALRLGLYKYEERGAKTEYLTKSIARSLVSGAVSLSAMAETKRIAKYLKARSERLSKDEGTYKDEPTGCAINLVSELVNIETKGADGVIRTSPGNGVSVTSQNVSVSAIEALKPIQESTFTVVANDIKLDASDYTYEKKDKGMQLTKTEAKGQVWINAKKTYLTGNDVNYKVEGEEVKREFLLTKDSKLYANYNSELFDMADENGKAQGIMMMNGKEIYINSYDSDKENRLKPTAVADGGKITLGAKDIYVGDVVKDMKCDMVQISGKNINAFGEEKVDLQQAKDKSHLLLDDKAELAASDIKLVGKIKLGGETQIDAKFTAGDIEAKNVKASSSVSGPNLKDGMPIPGAAAPEQAAKGAEVKELEVNDKILGEPEK